MTTVTSDGTRVATDSMTQIAGRRTENEREKIKLVDGYLFSITGTIYPFKYLIKWWLAGAKISEWPTFGKECEYIFAVYFRDKVIVYDSDSGYSDTHNYPCAFGSGTPYAYGALKAGSDANRACQIACQLDVNSAPPVHHLVIPNIRSTDPRPPLKKKRKPTAKKKAKRA